MLTFFQEKVPFQTPLFKHSPHEIFFHKVFQKPHKLPTQLSHPPSDDMVFSLPVSHIIKTNKSLHPTQHET
jgi:hypothetical protein